jgi:hypothetical protein
MRPPPLIATIALSFALASPAAAAQTAPTPPLAQAHAHNDYQHPRPLLDALQCGFCSVEADIHLVDGELLVAHDLSEVHPDRTLESLYLKPLQQQVSQQPSRFYPQAPPFTLLIDLKSSAENTYPVLRRILERYAEMLTKFQAGQIHTNAVTVILSGNRPTATLAAETVRFAAIDGRLSDLQSNPPLDLVPLISDNWAVHFSWRGRPPLPDAERSKLRELVQRAHAQGRRIRLWATPDVPEAWHELRLAGLDLINTDNLAGLRDFLLSTALPAAPHRLKIE